VSLPLLSATSLSKSYTGVRVLEGVSLDVRAGEVHALVGENGAGKSTLIKILGGAVRADSGDVRIGGGALPPGDPIEARRRGISTVYQEFTLVPELSVTDNVFLGREQGRPFLRRAAMARDVQAILDELGAGVDASAPVARLSVAHQQMVEIARALVGDAKVLILDEPTASLSSREVDRLFDVIRRLRGRGLGVIYISHRFEEIFALADRVTVLRDGRRITTVEAAGLERPQLIRWMVGRDVSEEFPARGASSGETVLDVKALSAPPRFSSVSFSVRRGEIVGLAGLVGAGRTSAGLAIAGALEARGDMSLGGAPARFGSPAEAIGRGVAYLTEDRKGRGLFPLMAAGENTTVASLGRLTRAGLLSIARDREAASQAAREFDVRVASLSQPAATVSGGNQQKLLLARFLMTQPKVVILDEPTRGVDVGARADIYRLMNRLTADGLAIIMISSDLPELLGMSDRVVVMREGRVTGELARGAATPETVMALATGAGG
jgi:ABC-type sugar transport system ATPase subunit